MRRFRVCTCEVRKKVGHDHGFVSRARSRRRLLNIVARGRRIRTRRVNEELSYAFWVHKMQRKAQSLINQQRKRGGLYGVNSIRL